MLHLANFQLRDVLRDTERSANVCIYSAIATLQTLCWFKLDIQKLTSSLGRKN